MKFRVGVQRVQSPPCQSVASRQVVSLAAVTVMGRLMRRQTNRWAAGVFSPKMIAILVPKGSISRKAASPATSRRAAGGPVGCKTAARLKRTPQEPGRPSTVLDEYPGHGGPVTSLRRAARPPVHERPTQNKHWYRGRPPQGKTIAADDAARESDDRIRAMTAGNGWHPDPPEQRRSVPEESFWRDTWPSTDEEKPCHQNCRR
jgi:hypothetical protein